MSVQKYVEVRCDFCREVIGHYEGSSIKIARRWAKEDGARLDNDLEFCNDDCYWKYQDQQVQAANNGEAK